MGPKPEGAIFYNADAKLLQYCDGTNWIPMHPQGSGSGGCTMVTQPGTKSESYIFYNADNRVMQACAGDVWRAMGPSHVPECPNTGDVCSDGSVYAGLSPDGNEPMYTTPADAGQYPWNNGNMSGSVTTNQTNATTGETNTGNLITIDSDSGTGGTQPHQAAQYCADLNAHGQTDWYLPAGNELSVLYSNRAEIGGFDPAGNYWSSSEAGSGVTLFARFQFGDQSVNNKGVSYSVRCVRKGAGSTSDCTDPVRPEGTLTYNSAYHAYQYCDGAAWVPIGKLIDREPDAFGFTDQSDVALSTLIESNIVAVGGITTAPVSISGDGSPEYRICNDAACTQVDHDWSSAGGWIDAGQYLQLRLTSNAASNTMNSATVSVGTVSEQWDVTTGADTSCPATPGAGDEGCEMPDGTYYIGHIGGGIHVYAAASDESGTYEWGGYENDAQADSNTDGLGNTDWLIDSSPDNHPAAQACRDKGAGWYLPARNELMLFWNGGSPVAGVNTSGSYYWSSSEVDTRTAWSRRFDFDFQKDDFTKIGNNLLVRCVRRSAPPPDSCETGAIGTVCADGAVYAGTTVGGLRMYVASTDESGTYEWGGEFFDENGDNNTVAPELLDDGLANTNWLVNDSSEDHPAADACRNKGPNWYLPARNELDVLYDNRVQLGEADLPFAGNDSGHWSSSEASGSTARYQRFDNGLQSNGFKDNDFAVRCVRND